MKGQVSWRHLFQRWNSRKSMRSDEILNNGAELEVEAKSGGISYWLYRQWRLSNTHGTINRNLVGIDGK